MSELTSLVVFVVVVFAAAISGAVFMPGAWYRSLDKPSWTPPDWLFAPAWTVLYVLIALAGWLTWRAEGLGTPLAFWLLNLLFNAAWSWLMFGQHRIGRALADALAMLATIVAFIATVWPVSQIAAVCFLPYLVWVAFASALNWSIWQRNRQPATGEQSDGRAPATDR